MFTILVGIRTVARKHSGKIVKKYQRLTAVAAQGTTPPANEMAILN
jgi:hypothetical protein